VTYQKIQPIPQVEIGSLCFWGEKVVRVVGGDGNFYVRVIDPTETNDNSNSFRAFRQSLVMLTKDEADIKGLTLPVRRKELIDNIYNGWRRLNGSDYRLIDRLRDYILGHYEDTVPNWFALSVASSADDSRQISWATEPHYIDNDVRRKRGRPTTFLRYLVKTYGASFDNEEIERLSYLIGEMLPKRDAFTFEIVNGDELYEYYQRGDGPQSCMRGESYVQMYADNPDVCEMVIVSLDGEYFGRALLWHTDEGQTVLDRIYPNSGIHVELLKSYATEQGWDYLEKQSYEEHFVSRRAYHVTIRRNDNGEFPYMDTFRYCYSDDITDPPFILTNQRNGAYHYILTDTDGSLDHDSDFCRSYEDNDDEEEGEGSGEYTYCGWYNDN
jgi:hypothetical protein